MWLLLLLIPVALYVANTYSNLKVAKKGCSTCPNNNPSV
jgi:hypothetical protein